MDKAFITSGQIMEAQHPAKELPVKRNIAAWCAPLLLGKMYSHDVRCGGRREISP